MYELYNVSYFLYVTYHIDVIEINVNSMFSTSIYEVFLCVPVFLISQLFTCWNGVSLELGKEC